MDAADFRARTAAHGASSGSESGSEFSQTVGENHLLASYLALLIAGLFTGAAFYVNFAEQPARLALDDGALLAQ